VSALLGDDVLARRLARAARRVAARDHRWSDVAAATVAVYERAVVEERDLRAAQRRPRRLRAAVPDGNLLRDDA
jgi:glycogen(starch) synthase